MPQYISYILENLPFLTIPIVSAVVGWITNVIALKMTFYPINFVGIPPYFGWQGIIPSKAVKMADISVDLMTTKLISVREVFLRINPEESAKAMEDSLKEVARKLTDEIMQMEAALIWDSMNEKQKEKIYQRVERQLPLAVSHMMQDMKDQISDLLDLKKLVTDVLLQDKELINQIFLKVGKNEFRFIEVSGFYFGLLFGLVQMGVFYFYDPWWMLPTFGLIVGYATNWLALKLIFFPIKPVKIFRNYEFQGMFIKRQFDVAAEYAKIIHNNILTTERIFDYILRGPNPQRFHKIVKKYTDASIDNMKPENSEWMNLFIESKLRVIKNIVFFRFKEEFPLVIRSFFWYADSVVQMEKTLRDKMSALSEHEFVEFLRPVFKEDEMKLIIVGAVLGFIAGLAQWYFFF